MEIFWTMSLSLEKKSTMAGIFVMVTGMITLASTDAISKYLTITSVSYTHLTLPTNREV